jgi:integrase
MQRQRTQKEAAGSCQQKLANVAECLYRSAQSRVYYGIVYVGKRQIKRSLHTTDRKLADHRLVEFRAKVGNLKPDEARSSSFFVIGCRWLIEHQHTLSQRTIRGKMDTIKALDAIFGDKPIRNLSADDVARWKAKRGGKLASRSFNWDLEIMRGVFGYALKRGLILQDPSADTERMPVKYRPITIPTKEEFKRLMEQLHGSYENAQAGNMIQLIAYSGCRKMEAAGLAWGDVDFQNNRIRVGIDRPDAKALEEDNIKTEASRRVIPMNPALRAFLEELKSQNPRAKPTDKVIGIMSARKGLQTACSKLWGKEKKDRFTHHDFRHLFATTCIESGVDIPTVSRWLGHKDGGALAMRVYGHLREQHSDKEAEKVKFD